jgi:hypothetical protein
MELHELDSSFVCYLLNRYFSVGVSLYQPLARRLEVGILDELDGISFLVFNNSKNLLCVIERFLA